MTVIVDASGYQPFSQSLHISVHTVIQRHKVKRND